jgi:hypothetical protein
MPRQLNSKIKQLEMIEIKSEMIILGIIFIVSMLIK